MLYLGRDEVGLSSTLAPPLFPSIRRFTVSGVELVESLRHFLEAFRLPSESPIISRILETFTEHWLVSHTH